MMRSQGKTSEDEEEEGQLLGTFSYDKSGPPIQEYTVHVCCSFHIIYCYIRLSEQYGSHLLYYGNGCIVFLQEGERTAYSYVLFKFLSNHGNPEYTCVYRVRVHGHGHYTH